MTGEVEGRSLLRFVRVRARLAWVALVLTALPLVPRVGSAFFGVLAVPGMEVLWLLFRWDTPTRDKSNLGWGILYLCLMSLLDFVIYFGFLSLVTWPSYAGARRRGNTGCS